uniref:Myosin VIIBb n=1 Tax=Electrophorus electricus TaxID=8005 RepID=A0A4W4H1U9_ELEEL
VKVTDGKLLRLVDDEGKELCVSEGQPNSIQAMHPTSVEGVDDMIKLGDLTEAGVLRNLMIRHKQGIIYTYIGSVLVAVNPYQLLPIYTAEQVWQYHGRRLGELPPHVFAIADSCYYNMLRKQCNQCCIISGESGAGKTETTKLILQFLAAVSGQHSWIEQQILQANPVLEAFGNAKTIRNDNSSRFGKYVEIFFNKEGVIEFAHMEQYLLEKSRVCHQAPQERNYHIFYCLLSGMAEDQKRILLLGNATQFKYLTEGDCVVCEGQDDVNEFTRIRTALKVLTFTEKECWEIFKLLAAILHMGNIGFEGEVRHVVLNDFHVHVSAPCQVERSALDTSLTCRSFMTSRERVTKPLSSEQATDCRDALAKAIYSRLFVWIFGKINSAIHKSQTRTSLSIGLLDIFGFENFIKNSFEQLCINYANEHLQQFFVAHIFKLEQEEYLKEGFTWNHITYTDNQCTLDLLALKPLNILALIDEESHFPKGTDTTMLNKINQVHNNSKIFLSSKSSHNMAFGIRHFAGAVHYDCNGFLEKNRDALSLDIITLIQKSSSKLLRQIFEVELRACMAKHLSTLSSQFRQSLDSLMKALSLCQPFFIRCFKPNETKLSMTFDRKLCMQQLRYSGMLETIKIRKSGYPIRHRFTEFLERYRVLLKTTDSDCCDAICRAVIQDKNDWKIGKTKIFVKVPVAFLERELSRKALIILRVMLGHKDRKTFLKKRSAALTVQKYWRGHRDRKEFGKLRQGLVRLQAVMHARQDCLEYRHRRTAAITLQTHTRGYLARKDLKHKRDAIILMQAHTRDLPARKQLEDDVHSFQQTSLTFPHLLVWDRQLNMLGNSVSHLVYGVSRVFVHEAIKASPLVLIFYLNFFLVVCQDFLPEPERQAQEFTSQELQKRLEEVLSQSQEAAANSVDTTDEEMVTSVFNFLSKTGGGQEAPAPKDLDEGTPDSNDENNEEEEEDEISFSKFSALHFQGSATHMHIQQRLWRPLLYHEDERDTLIIWLNLIVINAQYYCYYCCCNQSVTTYIERFIVLQCVEPSSLLEDKEEDDILIGEGPTLDRPMTALEKLHTIVGYGIVRPDIRDEIYCQICKQLTNNKNKNSSNQGWILLSICLGIFPPTKLLNKVRIHSILFYSILFYSILFYSVFVLFFSVMLHLETKEPIKVAVALMDGRDLSLEVDSASTSAELCSDIAQKTNLCDTFGFSLYITLYDKMWSLGSGGEHVLDAISQCEQEERRQGKEEQSAPWKLSFRKELFTPWHDCTFDHISTDLIYRQIICGIKSGEYQSDKEDEYVQLAAKHYYVQYGTKRSSEMVRSVVRECINLTVIESKSEAMLVQLVSLAHEQGPYTKSEENANTVKADVVGYACQKWPLYFSKFFMAHMISGPSLPQDQFVVAVNWSGLSFQEGKDRTFLQLTYPKHAISMMPMLTFFQLCLFVPPSASEGRLGEVVCITTPRDEYKLKVAKAHAMVEILNMFLVGLKERSVYAVVQQDINRPDDATLLSCRKGDLIYIIKDGEYSPKEGWMKGQNEKTGQSGAISTDAIMILPTLSRPSDEILMCLCGLSHATSHREPGTAGRQARAGGREKLWMRSKELLKQPLLKSLQNESDLSQLACQFSLNFALPILKYMGDYPTKTVRTPIELTDQIFGPALQYPALRDEVYSKLEPDRDIHFPSRGWQLLWLCCGLFPPSQILLTHAQRFLQSRPRDPLSAACLQRLQAMINCFRTMPPHQVEVDAIQQNSSQIFHKVHFPNDTTEIFEVNTTTRICDLCRNIAKNLMLSSSNGYGLFVKTTNKVPIFLDQNIKMFFSLKFPFETEIHHFQRAPTYGVQYRNDLNMKLWFNVLPGKDLTADLTFHFPQEVPKYLRGYHSMSKEEVISLGGLLFRVKVDTDRTQFVMIPKMLKDLVPADQLRIMSPEDWKKVSHAYNKQAGITVDEAKVSFLKTISQWPTFGCAFFEVKQTSDRSYPSIIMISISKQGVSIIDPKTKEVLDMHPFSKITNWSSGSTYFHLNVGNLVKGNTLLCETSLVRTTQQILNTNINFTIDE